jgi:hypothetical protein
MEGTPTVVLPNSSTVTRIFLNKTLTVIIDSADEMISVYQMKDGVKVLLTGKEALEALKQLQNVKSGIAQGAKTAARLANAAKAARLAKGVKAANGLAKGAKAATGLSKGAKAATGLAEKSFKMVDAKNMAVKYAGPVVTVLQACHATVKTVKAYK